MAFTSEAVILSHFVTYQSFDSSTRVFIVYDSGFKLTLNANAYFKLDEQDFQRNWELYIVCLAMKLARVRRRFCCLVPICNRFCRQKRLFS